MKNKSSYNKICLLIQSTIKKGKKNKTKNNLRKNITKFLIKYKKTLYFSKYIKKSFETITPAFSIKIRKIGKRRKRSIFIPKFITTKQRSFLANQ